MGATEQRTARNPLLGIDHRGLKINVILSPSTRSELVHLLTQSSGEAGLMLEITPEGGLTAQLKAKHSPHAPWSVSLGTVDLVFGPLYSSSVFH